MRSVKLGFETRRENLFSDFFSFQSLDTCIGLRCSFLKWQYFQSYFNLEPNGLIQWKKGLMLW